MNLVCMASTSSSGVVKTTSENASHCLASLLLVGDGRRASRVGKRRLIMASHCSSLECD